VAWWENRGGPEEPEQKVGLRPTPAKPFLLPRKNRADPGRSMVRKLAADRSGPQNVRGTGPQGRITKEDVRKASKEKKVPPKEIPAQESQGNPISIAHGVVGKDPAAGLPGHRPGYGEIESTIPPRRGTTRRTSPTGGLEARAKERDSEEDSLTSFLS